MHKHDWRSASRGKKAGLFLMFLMFAAVVVTVVGLVVMGLWNWLVPAVFAGSTITWVQAIGLFALGRILFGGWGGGRHRGGGPRWGRRNLEGLSPEERERMKQLMGRRFCGPRDEATTSVA